MTIGLLFRSVETFRYPSKKLLVRRSELRKLKSRSTLQLEEADCISGDLVTQLLNPVDSVGLLELCFTGFQPLSSSAWDDSIPGFYCYQEMAF